MYITQRSGPIMEPCGTVVVIDRVSEMLSSYVTYCFQLFKLLSINSRAISHIPCVCNLFNKILWPKVSNAFDISKNILICVSFESSSVIVLSITSMMAYSVE